MRTAKTTTTTKTKKAIKAEAEELSGARTAIEREAEEEVKNGYGAGYTYLSGTYTKTEANGTPLTEDMCLTERQYEKLSEFTDGLNQTAVQHNIFDHCRDHLRIPPSAPVTASVWFDTVSDYAACKLKNDDAPFAVGSPEEKTFCIYEGKPNCIKLSDIIDVYHDSTTKAVGTPLSERCGQKVKYSKDGKNYMWVYVWDSAKEVGRARKLMFK